MIKLKRFLLLPAALPGRAKAALWGIATASLTMLAYIAESAGVPRALCVAVAAGVVLPLVATMARAYCWLSSRRVTEVAKAARA